MIQPLSELDQSEGKDSKSYELYFNALARLLANDLEDDQLEPFRDEEGRALITQSSVAALAGKKRTRISGEKCDFPVLAAHIASLRSDYGVKSTTTDRIKRQSEDIAILLQRLKAVRSRLAESIIERDELVGKLADAEADLARSRAKRSQAR